VRAVLVPLASVLLAAPMLAADEKSIVFDENVDFSTVRTFAIRERTIDSDKPELDNRLFRQQLDDTVRTTLTSKRLREVATDPDVWIDYHLAGTDYSVIGGQRGLRIPPGPFGSRGTVIPGTGPRPELFTEGTLVIDMITNPAGALVWRGTYRDEEKSGPTLARKLPNDARALLSEYPPDR